MPKNVQIAQNLTQNELVFEKNQLFLRSRVYSNSSLESEKSEKTVL